MQGDAKSFDKNWSTREESCYTHWTRKEPENQIQLAFRNHWTLFNELMKNECFNGGKRCLEVGCGRGSISCYFSDAGYDCSLVDVSQEAIDIARMLFESNKLKGKFFVEDANNLSFKDGSFDILVSIGLLEHFDDIEKPLKEQIRVLDRGGIFLGYVVPKYDNNIQKDYDWINKILKGYVDNNTTRVKKDVFRSDEGSQRYVAIMQRCGLKSVCASGVYPLPMISHSINFPFSLMPEQSERSLVEKFNRMLQERRKETGEHPWLCPEGYGQAFLVWGYKA